MVLLHLSEQCNQPNLAIQAAGEAIHSSGRLAQVHAARQSPAFPNLWLGPRPHRPHAATVGAGTVPPPRQTVGRADAPLTIRSLVRRAGTRLTPRKGLSNVPYYFASDVHLRNDRPDRDRRFRAWLSRLTRDDALVIVGDLCDFWMGARRLHDDPLRSESLQALIEFRRQGGTLAIMAGNHDEWLCPFYQAELGAEIIAEPHLMTVHGLRLRLVHGHRLGARRAWKSLLEGRAFLQAFAHVPGPLARTLDQVLEWRNQRGPARRRRAPPERLSSAMRRSTKGQADIVVIGHVHRPVDLASQNPRLIVLGGWQRRSSFLKIDENGATLHVEHDRGREPPTEIPPRQPSLSHRGELDEI